MKIQYCTYSCDCIATDKGQWGEPVCWDHAPQAPVTSNCNDCGLIIQGDRYRCSQCYYAACSEAY